MGAFLWKTRIDHIPPGGFFDEIQNHMVAEGILHGNRPVFIADWTKMPALLFRPASIADMLGKLRRVLIAARFRCARLEQPTPAELQTIRLAWQSPAA